MLQRLYVHNFRCLENFELKTKEMSSLLLIGKNGTGKSTVAAVLEILQSIGRGTNRVGSLVRKTDFARGREDVPIRFELEVLLGGRLYQYSLALELPEGSKELRVLEEQLAVSGDPIYSRQGAQVTLGAQHREAQFLVDWHLIALPIIQEQSDRDPLRFFRTWLARTIILAPIPSGMMGDSKSATLEPERDGSNIGAWMAQLLSAYPASYTLMDRYLKEIIPDIKDFINIGEDFKSMVVRFEKDAARLNVNFRDLSDGEKCFFLCAVVLAANDAYGPLFCFWDEPDNYLSLTEVGHFVVSLRRSFSRGGQIFVTSHHPEAIRKFSNENTLMLYRNSHLEPTLMRPLSELLVTGDLIDALILDDVEI